MRIGIVADIHADSRRLAIALRLLRDAGVDQVVTLGDVIYAGGEIRDTVSLLFQNSVIGVWGNHDLGLCIDPDQWALEKFGTSVMRYMATLRPSLELDECLFTHGMPHWDATDPEIYYLGGGHSQDNVVRSLESFPQRVMFVGHFHRWFVGNRLGPLDWDGRAPIQLCDADRYLVVIGAVCNGKCACFDTSTRELVPFDFQTTSRGLEHAES